jgi:hypothetical protein
MRDVETDVEMDVTRHDLQENPRRMVCVLLNADEEAAPLLEVALHVGELFGGDVEAMHVMDGPFAELEVQSRDREIPLRLLKGPTVQSLLDALTAPGVVAAVFGTRPKVHGGCTIEPNVWRILQRTKTPIVIVPPEAVGGGPIRKLLVPLDAAMATSRTVLKSLESLVAHEVELIGGHVFTESTFPKMLNHEVRDMTILRNEFRDRHLPGATYAELMVGNITSSLLDLAQKEQADLIVLAWSQVVSKNRGRVVKEVLAVSTVPVLLLPIMSR